MVDESLDCEQFISACEKSIITETYLTQAAVQENNNSAIVLNTLNIAKRSNRIIQVANQEAENSEDPNYVNRIKKSSLKCFLDKKLDELDFYYYISTNLPNNFEEYSSNDKIRVFDIDKLRDGNNESKELELFPEDPTGLYPARYPWNCRRFIVEKAAKDGFDYVIYIDADTVFREDLSTEEFYNQIVANYEPNTVKTNSTIFRYKTKSPGDVFNFHDLYINHFNLNFEEDQYDTIDGPCQVFMGKSNEDILRFTFNWNKFAIFGYKKEFDALFIIF